jgi:hypothetical protein
VNEAILVNYRGKEGKAEKKRKKQESKLRKKE